MNGLIKNWLITGDTHASNIERLFQIDKKYKPDETALIILGDVGFNFFLNDTDKIRKKTCNDTGYIIYCLRGNHEERPENLNIPIVYDNEVGNYVYAEPQYPNIRYLMDGGDYLFNGHRTLVIGGAYSIDKYWRLGRAMPGETWTGWFEDEQLTEEEMDDISGNYKGQKFDFVLSHTCPYSWMPTDLFLDFVDQSTVDNRMEIWMDSLKDSITWGVWLFGHFHRDRVERPFVEQYFRVIENLEDVWKRWTNYADNELIKTQLNFAPKFQYYNEEKEKILQHIDKLYVI